MRQHRFPVSYARHSPPSFSHFNCRVAPPPLEFPTVPPQKAEIGPHISLLTGSTRVSSQRGTTCLLAKFYLVTTHPRWPGAARVDRPPVFLPPVCCFGPLAASISGSPGLTSRVFLFFKYFPPRPALRQIVSSKYLSTPGFLEPVLAIFMFPKFLTKAFSLQIWLLRHRLSEFQKTPRAKKEGRQTNDAGCPAASPREVRWRSSLRLRETGRNWENHATPPPPPRLPPPPPPPPHHSHRNRLAPRNV